MSGIRKKRTFGRPAGLTSCRNASAASCGTVHLGEPSDRPTSLALRTRSCSRLVACRSRGRAGLHTRVSIGDEHGFTLPDAQADATATWLIPDQLGPGEEPDNPRDRPMMVFGRIPKRPSQAHGGVSVASACSGRS